MTAAETLALADPGERGSLTIADRAIVAIARAAALQVRGVAGRSATTGRISGALGRDLPRASAQVAGHRARVAVEVASVWPVPAAVVAADVRDAVTRALDHLAAIQADAVAVSIERVVLSTSPRTSLR